MSVIAENLQVIRNKLGSATLIAVTKTKPVTAIQEAFAYGIRHFGENYLQEALPKIEALRNLPITWHYLGRLQSKKLKDIAGHFQVIHSLDHLDHAAKLNSICKNLNKNLDVFVQVNLDEEPQKGGVLPAELPQFIEALQKFSHIKVSGLMLIPKPDTANETLDKYHLLKEISKGLGNQTHGALSMGMSQDYELALQAGATHIRIGTAIFGERTSAL